MTESTTDILRANLAQLRRTEPQLAKRIEQTEPAELVWSESKSGPLTASWNKRTLASRYDPAGEADKLISEIDPTRHAAVVLLGLGLGYHIAHAVKMMGHEHCLVIVYEPNVSLLRAVLEKIDHTAWLGKANVIIADDTIDRGGLLGRIEGFGGIMTQGTVLITHPASRQTNGQELTAFGSMVTEVLAFFRTNVATALVNSSRTIRNNCLNIAYYAAGATTNELHNVAKGYPAVCVGAGPSLAKNIDLLRDPAIRKKIVLITAQTTLKPLLDRGIEPDFVTALDYHEISSRFYENLPPMENVTLVAEPKANQAILDSFPGPIRVSNNPFLDRMLGKFARPITAIRSGATVAHLSFYLAQHVGCDPIMLIGQDMGFSDGLYYCPGTAIHDVWATELNAFNTLEMMEWQRIVRHRLHLDRQEDIHGKSIYTDEQMMTYLKQFERDFIKAPQLVLDCTEGGLPKEHTTRMTLAEGLEKHATCVVPAFPRAEEGFDSERLEDVAKLLQQRLDEVHELREVSRKTVPLLMQMKKHQKNYDKACRIHDQIEKHKRRVDGLSETFGIVNELNTIGAFKRARADRAIRHNDENDALATQRQQIDRDADNIRWLIEACDEVLQIFRDAKQRVDQQRKQILETVS